MDLPWKPRVSYVAATRYIKKGESIGLLASKDPYTHEWVPTRLLEMTITDEATVYNPCTTLRTMNKVFMIASRDIAEDGRLFVTSGAVRASVSSR